MDCQTLRYIQRCDIYNGMDGGIHRTRSGLSNAVIYNRDGLGVGVGVGGLGGHCVSSTKDKEASHGN